jgi:hypothetical protein
MTPLEFEAEVENIMAKMKEVLVCKGHDYASNSDRFSNFRLCENMGLPAWKGILVRLGDKVSRLFSFASSQEMKVKDESFEDTCIDLANYALLLLCAYRESHGTQHYEELIISGGGPIIKFNKDLK